MQFKTIALHAFCTSISQYGDVINARHQVLQELRNWDLSPDGKLYEEKKMSIINASVEIR